jgi:hypothetical protein
MVGGHIEVDHDCDCDDEKYQVSYVMCRMEVTIAQAAAPPIERAVDFHLDFDTELRLYARRRICTTSGSAKMTKVKREKMPRLIQRPRRHDQRCQDEADALSD